MRASRRVVAHAVIAFTAATAVNAVADAQQTRATGRRPASRTTGTGRSTTSGSSGSGATTGAASGAATTTTTTTTSTTGTATTTSGSTTSAGTTSSGATTTTTTTGTTAGTTTGAAGAPNDGATSGTANTTDSGAGTGSTSQGTSTTAQTRTTSPARVDPVRREVDRSAEPRWGHQRQLSLRFAAAEGVRLAIRYGAGDPCSSSGAIFCYGRAPVLFDAVLGIAPVSYLEIEGRIRFGEFVNNGEVNAGGSMPLAAGLGIRYYGSDQSPLKFIFGFAAMVDFTAPGTGASARFPSDIVIRAEEGLQYDLNRYFGVYAQLGESVSFLRSLGLIVDVGLGVQGRY